MSSFSTSGAGDSAGSLELNDRRAANRPPPLQHPQVARKSSGALGAWQLADKLGSPRSRPIPAAAPVPPSPTSPDAAPAPAPAPEPAPILVSSEYSQSRHDKIRAEQSRFLDGDDDIESSSGDDAHMQAIRARQQAYQSSQRQGSDGSFKPQAVKRVASRESDHFRSNVAQDVLNSLRADEDDPDYGINAPMRASATLDKASVKGDYEPHPYRRGSINVSQRGSLQPVNRRSSLHAVNDDPKVTLVFKDMGAHNRSGKPVLQGITGFMSEGEIMAVMGLSGGGKTTFLRGLASPKNSNLLYKRNIMAMPGIRVGFVGDEHILLNELTVKETISYAILLDTPELDRYRLRKRRDRWISQMDLSEAKDRKIKHLSAGQRKRVEVAQLLVRSCTLMIMDEPLSALDSITALNLMKALRQLVDKERINIILSVHQPRSQIFECLDFVLLIHQGRMAYFGPAHTALDRVLSFTKPPNDIEADGHASEHRGYSNREPPTPNTAEDLVSNYSIQIHDTTEQAHYLLDILAANTYRAANQRSGAGRRKEALDVCAMFERSVYYQGLHSRVDAILAEAMKDQSLEPYKMYDKALTKGGYFWTRCVLATYRFTTDMFRDLSTYAIVLVTPLLLAMMLSTVWYGLGGPPTIDFINNQVGFFYTLGAFVFALTQLSIDRCSSLYRLFRQEHLDGFHSPWQFLVEAASISIWFPVLYSVMAMIPYFFFFEELKVDLLLFAANLILAITSQALIWMLIFATGGDAVMAVSIYVAIAQILLMGDGFVIPASVLPSQLAYAYLANPRTWYIKTTMIHVLCNGYCSESEYLKILSDSSEELRNTLSYGWIRQDQFMDPDDFARSYMQVLFDLSGYTMQEVVRNSVLILVCVVIGAIASLFIALRLFRSSTSNQVKVTQSKSWLGSQLTASRVMYAMCGLSFTIVIVLSSLFGDTGSKSVTEAYSGSSIVHYNPLRETYCPTCFGFPDDKDLTGDSGTAAVSAVYAQRTDVTFRQYIESIPAVRQICENNDFKKPTKQLALVDELDTLWNDFTPAGTKGFVENVAGLRTLQHAEGRLARLYTEAFGADNLKRLTSYVGAKFPFEDEPALEAYMQSTYGKSVDDALSEGRLYVFTGIDGFEYLSTPNRLGDNDHISTNPQVLFYRHSANEDLHTVAIQLGDAQHTPILVPEVGAGWDAAKAFVRNAISIRSLVVHLTRVHALNTAIGIGIENSLSKSHPVREVLKKLVDRFQYTITATRLVGGEFNMFLGISALDTLTLVGAAAANTDFARDIDFAARLAYRGLDDVNDGLHMPLRPLQLDLWTTTHQYAEQMVDLIYSFDSSVSSDDQVQSFARLLSSSKGGNIRGLVPGSTGCAVCGKAELTDLLARILFNGYLMNSFSMIQELSAELYYYPFVATNLRATKVPRSATEFTEQQFLDMFVDTEGMLLTMQSLNNNMGPVNLPLWDLADSLRHDGLKTIFADYLRELKELMTDFESSSHYIISSRMEYASLA